MAMPQPDTVLAYEAERDRRTQLLEQQLVQVRASGMPQPLQDIAASYLQLGLDTYRVENTVYTTIKPGSIAEPAVSVEFRVPFRDEDHLFSYMPQLRGVDLIASTESDTLIIGHAYPTTRRLWRWDMTTQGNLNIALSGFYDNPGTFFRRTLARKPELLKHYIKNVLDGGERNTTI